MQKVPDAAIPDAYTPDSPSMLTCGAGEMVCNNSCANLMTSELYCGNCNTQCSPTQGCLNGACVPANTSCMRVRELDPAAPDGMYRNPNNGASFYCDFTNGATIDGLFMGIYTSTYTGYALVTPTDLADPKLQNAFVTFFNLQGGLPLLQTWTSSNCCFRTTGAVDWKFGGIIVYPTKDGSASQCNQSGGYTTPNYFMFRGGAFDNVPLPQDYFTQHAPTAEAACSEGANPGFFWRKRNTLN